MVVLERGDWLPRSATRRSAFPGELVGPHYAPSLPAFGCLMRGGVVSAVGGSSALNAGAWIEDAAYWDGDWGGGVGWSSIQAVAAGREILNHLGGTTAATGGHDFRQACVDFTDVGVLWSPPSAGSTCGAVNSVFANEDRKFASALLGNVHVVSRAEARRLVWRGTTAVGVELSTGQIARANRAVVVAAGSEASALLLFRSGLDLEGLGANYVDHPTAALPFFAPSTGGACYSAVAFAPDYQLSYSLGESGVGSSLRLASRCLTCRFLATAAAIAAFLLNLLPWSPPWRLGVLFVTVSKPTTSARLRYDPRADALVATPPRLDATDRATLDRAVRAARAVLRRAHPGPLNALLARLAAPYVATCWHAAGGVPRHLALEPTDLRLKSTANVYVVGAPAMPRLPRANPMASCYAMGARLASIVVTSQVKSRGERCLESPRQVLPVPENCCRQILLSRPSL